MGLVRDSLATQCAKFLAAFALVLPGAAGVPAGARDPSAAPRPAPENTACYRCHAMATLAYRDQTGGAIVSLAVDPKKFSESNHARLKCGECHRAGYEQFPHSEKTHEEKLYCLNCHRDDPKFETFGFPRIEQQFRQSIHFEKLGDRFSCFSCHNPHEFEVSRGETDPRAVIAQDNGICLNCHASPVRFATLTWREFPLLSSGHTWLPNQERHWKTVRCVECHTPHTETLSHQILGAKQAERNCVACHTKDSILLTKLYRFRSQEERQRSGLAASVLFNEAYIPGMTRKLFLHRINLALFTLTVAGIGAHGWARWRSRRRVRK
ncbi:MAG: nitrate reductase [Acidobacteria bacterium]|nr:nitrate reductase [Acidobacteriota bacterium]